MPDAHLVGGGLGQILPHLARLQLAELGHAAVMIEHVQRDVLGHAAGQVGIDEAHQRHVGQRRDRSSRASTPAPTETISSRLGSVCSSPGGGCQASA